LKAGLSALSTSVSTVPSRNSAELAGECWTGWRWAAATSCSVSTPADAWEDWLTDLGNQWGQYEYVTSVGFAA